MLLQTVVSRPVFDLGRRASSCSLICAFGGYFKMEGQVQHTQRIHEHTMYIIQARDGC